MLFSATQTRNVEDLARISLRKAPLYIGVDDNKETSTVEGLEQVRGCKCVHVLDVRRAMKSWEMSPRDEAASVYLRLIVMQRGMDSSSVPEIWVYNKIYNVRKPCLVECMYFKWLVK